MRSLIINSMFASQVYRRCADELGSLPGVDLTMLTVDSWKMNGRPMPFEAVRAGAPYSTFVGGAGWQGRENRGFYTSGLAKAFRASRPEVLFLMEEPFSVFAAEILTVKKLLAPHIPVVFFTWNNLSLQEFDYRPSFFYRNVAKWTLSQMQYALTANTDGHNVLREVGFQQPIKTVGYGVDTDAYRTSDMEAVRALRTSLNTSEKDRVIGYVGRLIEMKGVDLLIRAFADVKQRHPEVPLKLLLLGSGEEQGALLRMAGELGIAQDVRHVPSVSHHEVPTYMHALGILVLPSRRRAMWAEQFGRVLVEAMAGGKIVIGSSSGAIPEVIGDAGFIFPENDAAGLAGQLIRAISLEAAERNMLLTAAAKRAEYFSWKRFVRDAFEALEFVTKNPSGVGK